MKAFQRFVGLLSFVAALLALGPAVATAQEVPLTVKGDTITVVTKLPFLVEAPKGPGLYFWSFPQGVTALDKGHELEITEAPKGTLTVGIKIVEADLDDTGKFKGFIQKFGTRKIAVQTITPPEPGPGPGPGPGPDPPKPPNPKPLIPHSGLRVMIVYESGELAKLPPNQLSALYATGVKSYLNAKCVMDENGKNRAWRLWDKDVDASPDSKWAQDAFARVREKSNGVYPWVLISSDKGGYEGPVRTATEFLAELKKYGGS